MLAGARVEGPNIRIRFPLTPTKRNRQGRYRPHRRTPHRTRSASFSRSGFFSDARGDRIATPLPPGLPARIACPTHFVPRIREACPARGFGQRSQNGYRNDGPPKNRLPSYGYRQSRKSGNGTAKREQDNDTAKTAAVFSPLRSRSGPDRAPPACRISDRATALPPR